MKGKILSFFIALVISISFDLSSKQTELLKQGDVKKVMEEILSQHVGKKEVTTDLLIQSIEEYCDLFDPWRIYLLESEVNNLTSLGDSDKNKLLKQYIQNDFSEFHKVDEIIQNAIIRARNIRNDILKNPDNLFAVSEVDQASSKWRDSEIKRPFPKDIIELKARIKDELTEYINIERKKYGEESISRNKKKTLLAMENWQKHHENGYLYQDDNGKELSPEQKENMFTTHVLKALAKSLDSHTAFFSPSEAHDMKVRLEKDFKGIGIVLERKPVGIVISKLIKGGPAEKSGQVFANDQVIKINGDDVENESLEAVMDKLRNNEHPKVSLTLKRSPSEIINVEITKENIQLNDERATYSYIPFEDGIIGKITLTSFYQGENGVTSEKDIRIAIGELKSHGNLKGLILDLRENGGGFLIQAVKVAGLFITNGVIVVSKYSNGEEKFYRDMDGKVIYDGPLIVLTSRATASAAEIVAESIQDYGVGIIVGDDHTYGKGTIQTQTVTNDDSRSYFKVTVGKYYTVSGKTPQLRGVKADVVVPGRLQDKQIGEIYSENALAFDTISSSYVDQFQDVESNLKPWYERYYLPTVQHKSAFWNSHLNDLRKRSASRILNNKDYAQFIKQEGEWSLEASNNDNKKDDPQMLEAINILKEMVNVYNKANVVEH